ncbi:MAG: metal-sensing transcriptional repressor [Oscillospiraceae bacterium]|uniref:metal-sensing transcriptional repressor n=1 Tax=Butyricicoccus sp. TaxID=2049021 RepID=UPI002A9A0449|nr:metal-sensing transcriptional repressor [Clostridiales bacterium]MDD6108360.1 metal-sensing transcriptional repressor [Clostridiales bacterium]MDY6095187.1 metal-sensing transcriptional repressor [Oscillospiraceae bacterium]
MSQQEHCHDHVHEHTHTDANGHVYTHSHGEGDTHPHTHSHTQTKAVLNRLSRAIGHLESVKRMVEDGRDCTEVLVQLAAVRSALNNTAKVILKDHIEHCLADAVETGDQQSIEDLNTAIEKFMS